MLPSALGKTQTDRSRPGHERPDGLLPVQHGKVRFSLLLLQTLSDHAEYKKRKDTHPDIESIRPVPLGPMAQVEDGTFEIAQLHARDVQEWKVLYALKTFEQEHVYDWGETTEHKCQKTGDTVKIASQ